MEICFVMKVSIYLRISVHKCGVYIVYLFSIVKYSSMHRFQLGFINGFIYPLGLIGLTNFDVINLRR